MYSFAERTDVTVVDEPLYGHYLRTSGAAHPGADEVMASMNCDGGAVMRDLLEQAARPGSNRLFMKHMAHHLVDIDLDFLEHTANLLLIRDPREMLPSLRIQLPQAVPADTGLQRQCQLLDELRARGQEPVVLDSRELLLDPQGVLQQACAALGMRFDRNMLQWPAGPRPEDGVWAKHWYHAVHRSTGFVSYSPKQEFPPELEALLAACQPAYDRLFAAAIRARKEGR